MDTARSGGTTGDILRLAAWAALITGLIEGAGFLFLQDRGWLAFNMSVTPVSVEIIWISAAFNLLLFGAVGLLLALGQRILPRVPILTAAVVVFAFLATFDWLDLSGRIRHRSAVLLAAGIAVACSRWFGAHEPLARRVVRRSLPIIAGLTVLAALGIEGNKWLNERNAIAALPPARPGAPSVLVIVMDTVRADHLSSYGYARPTTPNIDRLAREGVLFEKAFSPSSWTLPSHASMLTGAYAHDHKADMYGLDNRLPTLPEAMKDAGYATAAFSGNQIYFTRAEGMGRGFIRFEDYFHSVGDMAARTLYGREFSWFVLRSWIHDDFVARKRAYHVNDETIAWNRRHADRPQLLFVNYFDAHDPYLPPEPYRSKFTPVANPGGIVNSFMFRLRPKLTAQQLDGEISAYDGGINYIDEHIGALVEQVRQQTPNLLVVITSDHGESFGEHDLWTHKNSLYREVIHVPLILWWPGHLDGGVRIDTPVTTAAIAATIVELAGGSASAFPLGSLSPLWKDPSTRATWPLPLAEIARQPYATLKPFNIPAYYGAMQSLIDSQDHFIVNETLGTELYEWTTDPREERNLVQHAEKGETLATFRTRLSQAVPGTTSTARR